MIDLHCHILPHVDDGADNGKVACLMAQHSLSNGVDTVVATPHCNLIGARGNFRGRSFEEALGLFRALLKQHDIPLTVLPGAELFAHESNLSQLLEENRIVTLNRSRYLLVEFNFYSDAFSLFSALERIDRKGYIPVIAHPERYTAVQNSPELVREWFARGYIIQVNKGSILGRLGRQAQSTSLALLQAGLVHVIASDAHNMTHRPPGFRSLLPQLKQLCPPEYIELLLETNPYRIICDKPIPMENFN